LSGKQSFDRACNGWKRQSLQARIFERRGSLELAASEIATLRSQ
jgi:hypothetical protein